MLRIGILVAPYVFGSLAFASFTHTWFYMFRFLSWSFHDFESHSRSVEASATMRLIAWLKNTELFEQAWAAVCSRPLNWWWSEQLCLFTVGAWTIFLVLRGRLHSIKHVWAYMLVGQLVAISVATNLFFLAVSLSGKGHAVSESRSALTRAPFILTFCVVVSMTTVALSPFTSERTFLPNLLTMHTLIFLPLFPWFLRSKSSKTLMSSRVLSLPAEMQSFTGFLTAIGATLYSHPAQSSIGWDVVWTSISFLTWIALDHTVTPPPSPHLKPFLLPLFTSLTVALSAGVSAPFVLLASTPREAPQKKE
ncbi:unnamed protein product [Somion occarium]|uniref:Uncharacterized protein n=1 Tax=Somion occarium TaxID=3059160 RepID=A0ABP1CN86_9APHY